MPELTASDIRDLVGNSPLMLEIGANDGCDTVKFLEVMPGATIHCFEPDPRAIKRWKKNVKCDRAILHECAVGNLGQKVTFHGSSGVAPRHMVPSPPPSCHLLEEWDLSGSMLAPSRHLSYSPWVTFPREREYEVGCVCLDTWAEGALSKYPFTFTVDFIWCDTQGAEGLVVQGGIETLKRTRWFYTETYNDPLYAGQPTTNELKNLVAKLLPDYEYVRQYNDNILFRNKALT